MSPAQSARGSLGLLLVRIVFGLAFVLHGLPKAAHPFSWADKFAPGLPPWLQLLVAIAEVGGGLLLLFGALHPLGAALLAGDMIGAFLTVTLPHGGTVFIDDRAGAVSFEKNAIYLAVALGLLLTGPGRYALDAVLFRPANALRDRLRS